MMTFAKLIKFVVLAALSAVLLWLVVTRSFVASFADRTPRTALALRPTDARALVNLSGKAINQTANSKNIKDDKQRQKLKGWIRQSLLESPLNARAFRLLGQISEKEGKAALVYKNMEMAQHLSVRESVAAYWLMQKSYGAKDYGRSLYYANNLLWHRPALMKDIIPLLADIAKNNAERGKLVAILAQNPRWRQRFFRVLPLAIRDARTPLTLFTSLKKTAAPPTKPELRHYFNFLNRKKLYNLSYYGWLQFLPPEHLAKTGFLFNGNFDMPLDNMPFNWVIRKGKGALSKIESSPDNRAQKVLAIRLSRGRSDFGKISQIVMLAPGRHIFGGRHKGALIGARGLRWRAECLGKRRKKIGESPMFIGRKRNWQNFSMAFTVPEQGCVAQYISLVLDARTRSEKLASGHIWYSRLKIMPQRNMP